ncbi:trypsin-like peptidase domain-containing protein [Pseudomonas urmiensis]|uniref:trypsin-like peptidase domain-containing protein n=1 Tax=Pseudomonas urmiensis TaxID=2745493 RepID=UPI003C9B6150
MFKRHPFCLGAALISLTITASAEDTVQPSAPTPELLTNAHGERRQWTGIGRLTRPGGSQCIASLIDSRAPGMAASGPAYLVTAGHCVDKRNGVIGHDTEIEGSISFNFFVDTQDQRHTFALKRTVWSSMQGLDLALLELDASLSQVMAHGIVPLALAADSPPGANVHVIGESSANELGLRLTTCSQATTDFVIAAPWVWRNIYSNDCLGLGPGSSGSAVIDVQSGRLLSVLNSVSEPISGKAAPCSLSSPCQVPVQTDKPALTTGFSIPLGRLQGCFAQGFANLSLDSCQLLPGFELIVERNPRSLTKIATDAEGNERLPRWGLSFSLNTPRYRYKTVRNPLACENPEGYSGTIAAEQNHIDEPIGPEPGWHFLCLLGVDSAEHKPSPALMGNSLSLATQLLPAAPVPDPDMTVTTLPNGNVQVSWRTAPPHLTLYRVKRGPPATTDCQDPAGFRHLRHKRYEFKAQQLPLTLCTVSEDLIEQRSAVRTDLLQPAASGKK